MRAVNLLSDDTREALLRLFERRRTMPTSCPTHTVSHDEQQASADDPCEKCGVLRWQHGRHDDTIEDTIAFVLESTKREWAP